MTAPEKPSTMDVIIIGGGPAGMTSAIYCSRAGLSTLLLEGAVMGGQAAIADRIDNYPGFPNGISGAELAAMMEQQARRFGAVLASDAVSAISREEGGIFNIKGGNGEYLARTIIIASGTEHRRLGIKGEEEMIGKGVSFCATCDGVFFRGRKVAVFGGGDSAVKEALFLTKFATKVVVVHRRDKLRAEKVIQDEAFANPKISFIWDTIPLEISGTDEVTGVQLKNVKSGEISELSVDGVFVFVGTSPGTGYLRGLIEMDESGYIITDDKMKTSKEGIFAAGDVRRKLLRQVSTAVGDGAVAARSAEEYLSEHHLTSSPPGGRGLR